MPHITFLLSDGSEHRLEASEGASVMQTALDNNVPGILAECAGCTTCATCKVEVSGDWIDRLPAAGEMEISLLDGLSANVRLSCQIAISRDVDGLVVRVPRSQYS